MLTKRKGKNGKIKKGSPQPVQGPGQQKKATLCRNQSLNLTVPKEEIIKHYAV